MLVGGVEDDDCAPEQSTVMALLTDSVEGARVISGRDEASSLREAAKSIVVSLYVASIFVVDSLETKGC